MVKDGVSLGWVEIDNADTTVIPRSDMSLLPFEGNVSIMKNDPKKVAVTAGFGKYIGENKKVGIFDTETLQFTPIDDNDNISAYPDISPSGKDILFAGVSYNADNKNKFTGTRIYSAKIQNKEVKALTPESEYSDYSPIFYNNGKSVLFTRQASDLSLSLWRMKSLSQEPEMLADNIKALTNYYEYGYYNFGKIIDTYSK